MSIPRFPTPGNRVLRVPALPGVTRYRQAFNKITVPVIADPVDSSGTPDPTSIDRYRPLAKLIIDGDVKRHYTTIACDTNAYSIEDTTRNCAIWVMALFPGDSTVISPIEFQIRQAVDNIPEVRFTGVYTPLTFADTGLLAQVNGAAANEWELWGRIAPSVEPTPVAVPYAIVVQFCLNAEDSVNACIRGALVKGSI